MMVLEYIILFFFFFFLISSVVLFLFTVKFQDLSGIWPLKRPLRFMKKPGMLTLIAER